MNRQPWELHLAGGKEKGKGKARGGRRGRGRRGRRGGGRPSWGSERRCRNGPAGGETRGVGCPASALGPLRPAISQ